MSSQTYFLYILLCSNDTFYIGYTTDIERRWQEHLQGSTKCKYTRSFPPQKMLVCWQFNDTEKKVALSLERKLKQLTRAQKSELIMHPKQLETLTTETVHYDVIVHEVI